METNKPEPDLQEELKAMQDCLYALLPLSRRARERVMRWVYSKIESVESEEKPE